MKPKIAIIHIEADVVYSLKIGASGQLVSFIFHKDSMEELRKTHQIKDTNGGEYV